MIKTLTCIECPKSCILSADIENSKVRDVKGAKCPKGIGYAIAELENPARILTSTVRVDRLAEGLGLKLIPVRTDKPIPKKDLLKAMEEIGKIRITKKLSAGDTIVEDLLGLGVRLVATRTVEGHV